MTAITTTGQTQAELDFQEKMKERMRQAMGDLMPDAVLAGIVARGIEEAFFKKRVRPGRNSWDRDETYEPWLVEYLTTQCKAQTQAAVNAWIGANHERIAAEVKAALDRGLASAVVAAMDSLFQPAIEHLKSELTNVISGLRDVSR